MPSLLTIFREMPDPRCGNARRHDLLDILLIALVASVCGAESCVDFAEFAAVVPLHIAAVHRHRPFAEEPCDVEIVHRVVREQHAVLLLLLHPRGLLHRR